MDTNQLFSRSNKKLGQLRLSRSTSQVSTELDGETVILNITAGVYSGLDPVGTAIWNILEKPVTFSQIVEEILTRYDVTEDQCIDDMLLFLKDLADNQLIAISDEKVA
jgi:hypothetical protein